MKTKGKRNPKKGGKRKPEFTKRQREVESVDMESNSKVDAHQTTPNDWRWYAANPELVKNYASFPFGFPVGTPYPSNSIGAGTTTPGAIAMYFTPVFGDLSAGEVAPLNIAMRKFYTYVRHENSGAKNYEAPDLMLYYMAVDSCYTFWSFLKRIAGILPLYTPYNKYYPSALISMMGVNPESIFSQVADFRGLVNQFAYRLNALRMPNSFSYSARHMWMCDGLYTDSTSAKAQTYFYTPSSVWKFNPTLTEGNVGGLELVTIHDPYVFSSSFKGLTLANLKDLCDSLLNPLIANEDINIMSGDILKAFGENGCVHLAPIPETYVVLPTYSSEVSSQIENAFIYGGYLKGNITQQTGVGTGYLTYTNPYKDASNNPIYPNSLVVQMQNSSSSSNVLQALTTTRMVNFHHDNVTPEEFMVATRLTNIPKGSLVTKGSLTSLYLDMTTAGSEIIVGAKFGFINGSGVFTTQTFNSIGIYALTSGGISDMIQSIYRLSDFDWAPNVWYFAETADGSSNAQAYGYTLDVDNYTFVTQDNLSKLSEVALLNMLSV